jgi:hypothetical protein
MKSSFLAALLLIGSLVQTVSAQTIVGGAVAPSYGIVQVCYYSTECNFADLPEVIRSPSVMQRMRDAGEHQGAQRAAAPPASTPVDAPAFKFINRGKVAITAASFIITANKTLGVVRDSFHIGTIKPGGFFVLVPGVSNDKKVHPSGGFFTFNSPGNPLDTSDSGPDDNALKFIFTGKVGTQAVTTALIEPGNFLKPSTDGTVASLNFLGGPGNADGPCNDCYPVTTIGTIVAASANADTGGK